MNRKVIGPAKDFYRARIITIQAEVPPDFDWRDDILYRSPGEYKGKAMTRYSVEVVELDSDINYVIRSVKNRRVAEKKIEKINEDLQDMTKMQFEKKYQFLTLAEKQK